MVKTILLTLLLILNCFFVCFADNPTPPAPFLENMQVPWIFVDSSNGIDTYAMITDYEQEGRSYRVPPHETGTVDVLYDYKSESKVMLTSFLFDYLNNTYHETTITRPVIKYNGMQTKRIGFDNKPNSKQAPIPKGSLIEKIAAVSRKNGSIMLEKSLCGTFLTKGTDGSFDNDAPSIRVLKYGGNAFRVIFITGDSIALNGYFNGKTNYCSAHYAVHESRRDGSTQGGAALNLYVTMGDSEIDLDNYSSKAPLFDIYSLKITGSPSSNEMYYKLAREKEGTMHSQRDYSREGRVWCLSR